MHRPQVSYAAQIGSRKGIIPGDRFRSRRESCVMTGARPSPQTTCVSERCTSIRASDLTGYGSSCVDMTSSGGSGGPAWTSTKRRAFKNADGALITGTSASVVVSSGEQFQFPRPGNG